ncbi:MAG: hypothetical protein RO257_01705 [Candidatus Kapabacteria bacterium]|jgi:hypothetical protein|nr:hypothetical protein [Candidatus Kapabacteria bacterium]
MKKLLLLLILVSLSYSVSYAECNCDTTTAWTWDSISWDIPDDCWIWAEYEYRVVECNGITQYEFRVLGWVAALTGCELEGYCTQPPCVWEFVSHSLLEEGVIPGFPVLQPGECRETYISVGPACWETVYRAIGPGGAGYYNYPCAETPVCCRGFKICKSYQNVVTITSLPYTPVACGAVIGPETGQPCFSVCYSQE